MGKDESLKPIILGAVRTRTPLTVEHFLNDPRTRLAVLDVLASDDVALELMRFDQGVPDLTGVSTEDRLKILDDQRNYLLTHPRRGNNRPIPVGEIVRQRQKLR